MRRTLLIAALSIPASVAAHAEDFSGFYAGVHAGAAMERQGGRVSTAPAAGPPPRASADLGGGGLPPSAANAAMSLKRAGVPGPGTR